MQVLDAEELRSPAERCCGCIHDRVHVIALFVAFGVFLLVCNYGRVTRLRKWTFTRMRSEILVHRTLPRPMWSRTTAVVAWFGLGIVGLIFADMLITDFGILNWIDPILNSVADNSDSPEAIQSSFALVYAGLSAGLIIPLFMTPVIAGIVQHFRIRTERTVSSPSR